MVDLRLPLLACPTSQFSASPRPPALQDLQTSRFRIRRSIRFSGTLNELKAREVMRFVLQRRVDAGIKLGNMEGYQNCPLDALAFIGALAGEPCAVGLEALTSDERGCPVSGNSVAITGCYTRRYGPFASIPCRSCRPCFWKALVFPSCHHSIPGHPHFR